MREGEENCRVHLRIYGRVQGVFFRYETENVARKMNLVGWVRNNYDGSVETVAEGPREALEKFIEWCKKGPSRARVDKVDINWEKPTGEFKTFRIEY